MSTGYATDSSNGSNKRVRHANSATVVTLPGAADNDANQQRSPLDLGTATIIRNTASLQFSLRNRVRFYATTALQAYTTWLYAQKNYDNEVNDDSFIPTECRIKHKLQPRKRVATAEGFKQLSRECQTAVEKCRLDLKKVEMKLAKMNVLDMRADITEAFCKAIPDIAEVLYAEYDIKGVSKHTAMANLVRHHRDEAISFLNVTDEEFRASYLRINNLTDFPLPSNPPLFTPGPGGPLQMRGGNDNTQHNEGGGQPPQQQAARPPTPAESAIAQAAAMGIPLHSQAEVTPQTANTATANPYAASGRGRGRSNNIMPTPRQLGFITAAAQLQLEGNVDTTQNNSQFALLDEGNEQDGSGAPLQLQQQTQDEEEEPPISQEQQQDVNAPDINGGDANNVAQDHVIMDDAENDGGGTGTGEGDNDNVNNDAQTAAAADGNTNPDLKRVHRQLLDLIEMAFIKPRTIYDKQKRSNDAARRMNEVVKRQTTMAEADKVAEAISQEGNVDPTIVKIAIRTEVDSALERAMKEKKKKESQQKQQQQVNKEKKTSNKARGPTDRGRLRTKRNHLPTKPPPKSSSKSPRRNGAAANSNATGGGTKANGDSSTSRQSRQKKKTSQTKQSKAKKRSQKK